MHIGKRWGLIQLITVGDQMPLYEFKCPSHGTVSTTTQYGVVPECELCKNQMRRIYSFYVEKAFVPHFNPSVGAFVSSQTDFNNRLAAMSEAETERTGIYHNYIPIEQGDAAGFGLTSDDLAMAEDARGSNPGPHESLV